MPDASTLSLGQSTFNLGPDITRSGTPPVELNVGGHGPAFFVSKLTPGPIDGLILDTALSDPASSNSAIFSSDVLNLDANLGDGSDSITFTASVSNSTIFTDSTSASVSGGSDRFVANGIVSDSTISTGWGNDTLIFTSGVVGSSIQTGQGNDSVIFSKEVIESTIETGGGNDKVNVQAFVSDTSFELGDGSDTLTFGANLVGFGSNSFIELGDGADTLIFGANSLVFGYSIDLGAADAAIDSVQFGGSLDETNLIQITGASSGDILIIGAGSFAGSYTFADGVGFTDGTDTLTWLS